MRHELTTATNTATMLLIGVLVIMAALAFRRWLSVRYNHKQAQEAAYRAAFENMDADLQLAAELAKPCHRRDRVWWENFCRVNELPESTRITLLAGIGEEDREVAA